MWWFIRVYILTYTCNRSSFIQSSNFHFSLFFPSFFREFRSRFFPPLLISYSFHFFFFFFFRSIISTCFDFGRNFRRARFDERIRTRASMHEGTCETRICNFEKLFREEFLIDENPMIDRWIHPMRLFFFFPGFYFERVTSWRFFFPQTFTLASASPCV